MFDIIIKNGTIIDGSGKQRFNGDIAIKRDKIVKIGKLPDKALAKKVINAKGMIVSPGIIDIHTHTDLSLYRRDADTLLEPLMKQGITTTVGGNCGFGLAPFNKKNHLFQKDYLNTVTNIQFDHSLPWTTMDEFMLFLDKKDLPMNIALLAPHGLIRHGATGKDVHRITSETMKQMRKDIESCMETGTFGLSAGLQYYPGIYSDTAELVDIASVLKKYDGVFTCHLRSYTTTTIKNAFEELYSIIRPHGIRGQISHIFALPWKGIIQKPYLAMVRFLIKHADFFLKIIPEKMITLDQDIVLGYFYKGKKDGLRIGMDIMPTATGFTPLLAFLPSWIAQENLDVMLKRLADPDVRKELIKDIEKGRPKWPHSGKNDWSLNLFKQLGYGCSHIMGVVSENKKHLEGQSLYELAKKLKKHPVDYTCDLLVEERCHVLTYESVCQPDDPFTEVSQYPPLFDPNVSIVTDTLLMGFGRPSYLFYGAFPKFYGHYARDKKRIRLEDAVFKCTYLPASQIGIPSRGLVKEGYFADVIIFNDAIIGTTATFENPAQDPIGISHILINGKVVLENNIIKLNKAGRLIRRGE